MDRSPAAQLYRRQGAAIHRHCRRLLGSAAAAQLATKETFSHLQARRPRVASAEHLVRYLYRVATIVCLGRARQRRISARNFASVLLGRCDALGVEIAILHLVEDMPTTAIAARLGVSRRTVDDRLLQIETLAREALLAL
jgi:DNA-directed RNA polymerase specialized sigma24 family protein